MVLDQGVVNFSFENARSAMGRSRMANFPPLPARRSELQHAIHSFQLSTNFYYASVYDREHSGHIFMTPHMRDLLQTSSNWFVDATFKISPRFVYQVLVIGVKKQAFFIGALVLMTRRSESLYKKIFLEIKNCVGSPRTIMCDYEIALRSSLRQIFESIVNGCFYHFSNSIIKKVRSLGLANAYSNNNFFRDFVLKCIALALLPENLILNSYSAFRNNRIFLTDQNYEAFRAYFEHYWLETQTPHNFCVFQCQNRTNNGMESLNRTLGRVLGSHSNLFAFISKSKEFLRVQEVEYSQFQNGLQIRRSLNRYEIFKNRQVSAASRALSENQITPLDFINRVKTVMSRLVDLRVIRQAADPGDYNHQEHVIMEANDDSIEDVPDDNVTTLSSGNTSSVDFPPFPEIFEVNLEENNNDIDRIQGILSGTDFESRTDITCAICLENGGELFNLNCRHGGFHSQCLSNWLRAGNSTCPICRTNIEDIIVPIFNFR